MDAPGTVRSDTDGSYLLDVSQFADIDGTSRRSKADVVEAAVTVRDFMSTSPRRLGHNRTFVFRSAGASGRPLSGGFKGVWHMFTRIVCPNCSHVGATAALLPRILICSQCGHGALIRSGKPARPDLTRQEGRGYPADAHPDASMARSAA
jgi:hypothetical protein